MKRIFLIGMLLVATGCGQQETNPDATQPTSNGASVKSNDSPSAPEDEAAAIDIFQSQALASLPQDLTPAMREITVNKINDRKNLAARQTNYEAYFSRIDGTLTQSERESLILFGAISDLKDQSGNCWEISSFGGMDDEIQACIDGQTGKLLILWFAPEG